MRYLLLIAALALPAAAFADCPQPDPAQAAETTPLLERLAVSKDQSSGGQIASQIWSLWATAPDKKAQELLDKGMFSIRIGSYDEAELALTYLIDYCPDYAEGWNQRAYARFLKADYDLALEDLDRTLALEPRHFGALSGRGLTLLNQGRQILGMQAIRDALKIHPWLNERRLLPPEERT